METRGWKLVLHQSCSSGKIYDRTESQTSPVVEAVRVAVGDGVETSLEQGPWNRKGPRWFTSRSTNMCGGGAPQSHCRDGRTVLVLGPYSGRREGPSTLDTDIGTEWAFRGTRPQSRWQLEIYV